jgi:hypothetical protein
MKYNGIDDIKWWLVSTSFKGKLRDFFYMLAKYIPGDIKYIFTKFYRHISTNNEANRKSQICNFNFYFFHGLWRFSPIITLWDWKLKSGSLMLNLLHLKRSEDCNLNLITVEKLNTEVNSYVPFWQTTILNEQNVSFPLYLQRKECFTTVTYVHYM